MRIVELRIEQAVTASAETGHQMDQRNLGRIRPAREHALAKEGAAERDAVQAANQLVIFRPTLDTVRMSFPVKRRIEIQDRIIDPGRGPCRMWFCAGFQDAIEGGVRGVDSLFFPEPSVRGYPIARCLGAGRGCGEGPLRAG